MRLLVKPPWPVKLENAGNTNEFRLVESILSYNMLSFIVIAL